MISATTFVSHPKGVGEFASFASKARMFFDGTVLRTTVFELRFECFLFGNKGVGKIAMAGTQQYRAYQKEIEYVPFFHASFLLVL